MELDETEEEEVESTAVPWREESKDGEDKISIQKLKTILRPRGPEKETTRS